MMQPLAILVLAQLASSHPAANSRLSPSQLQARSPDPQLGELISAITGGLGSVLSGIGTGIGTTLNCTVGLLIGGCTKNGALSNSVEGLISGVGSLLSGAGSSIGSTLNNTLNPLLGVKGPGNEDRNAVEAAIEGLLGGIGNLVSGAGSDIGNTIGDTFNPLLGVTNNNNGKIKPREPSPKPQLGDAVGGLLGGLGSLVSGLGGGLANTLGGVLSPLLGAGGSNTAPKPSAPPSPTLLPRPSPSPAPSLAAPWWFFSLAPTPNPAPMPIPSPAPSSMVPWFQPPRPSPTPEPNRGKKAATGVTTHRETVLCRKYPDTLVVNNEDKLQKFSSLSRLVVQCWSNPSIEGNSGRVDGEALWLRTSEDCFVNRAEIRERDDFKAILHECPPTRHWVGMLQGQYTRKDCYDCTSLDCPSKNLENPPYVDLDCHVQGEDVRGDTKWYRNSEFNCYFPAAVFNPNGWLGSSGDMCKR